MTFNESCKLIDIASDYLEDHESSVNDLMSITYNSIEECIDHILCRIPSHLKVGFVNTLEKWFGYIINREELKHLN